MNLARFQQLTALYGKLRVAVVGDFCLDRYFDIDPRKAEVSLETGLAVHNIIRVRCQGGAAGTILNNLVALGVGDLYPVGCCGEDGEGWELLRSLRRLPGVRLDHFVQDSGIHTFTYTKPLILEPGKPPVELHRLDIKNWEPTPISAQVRITSAISDLAPRVDAVIVLDQVDVPETGVITRRALEAVAIEQRRFPSLPILADSRRGLQGFPPVIFKMNGRELGALSGVPGDVSLEQIADAARGLARRHGRAVFVTLAERGMLGASPDGSVEHRPSFPIRGEIDIVGAGDSVTANLACALAAGGTAGDAIELASAAASIVIHQLGTTGAATVPQIAELLGFRP